MRFPARQNSRIHTAKKSGKLRRGARLCPLQTMREKRQDPENPHSMCRRVVLRTPWPQDQVDAPGWATAPGIPARRSQIVGDTPGGLDCWARHLFGGPCFVAVPFAFVCQCGQVRPLLRHPGFCRPAWMKTVPRQGRMRTITTWRRHVSRNTAPFALPSRIPPRSGLDRCPNPFPMTNPAGTGR